jgi:thiamine-phosphate pyrophosphorylase
VIKFSRNSGQAAEVADVLTPGNTRAFLFLPQSALMTAAWLWRPLVSTAPELYVTLEIHPGTGGVAATAAALQAAIKATPIASLLIRPRAGSSLDASITKTVLDAAQKNGVATLVADDANLARMLKADGVHLSWSKDIVERYREARDILGAHALIGADAGRSRDDAMSLGELGADYVAFGIPPHVEDRATAEDRQRDLISWWSEIFQVPCVAFDVTTPELARGLAQDGADFISVAIPAAMLPDEIKQRVSEFSRAIAAAGVLA